MVRANSSLRWLDLSDNMLCGLDWRGRGTPNLPLLTDLGHAVSESALRWLGVINNGLYANEQCSAVWNAALATRPPSLELCYVLSESGKRAHLARQAAYRRGGGVGVGHVERSVRSALASLLDERLSDEAARTHPAVQAPA
eukprot:3982378-Prymnesium_polylepis.1